MSESLFRTNFISLITLAILIGPSDVLGMKGIAHDEKKTNSSELSKKVSVAPEKAKKYFKQQFFFSKPLLDHEAITKDQLKLGDKIYYSALYYDACVNKNSKSLNFLSNNRKHISRDQFTELVEAGIEMQCPWAFFEKGEQEKTNEAPINRWHYLAASRGHTGAKLYVESAYSRSKYSFLRLLNLDDKELPEKVEAAKKNDLLWKGMITKAQEFWEEWKDKDYAPPLIDLYNFQSRVKTVLFEDLDVEIHRLLGNTSALYLRGQHFCGLHDFARALHFYELAMIVSPLRSLECARSNPSDTNLQTFLDFTNAMVGSANIYYTQGDASLQNHARALQLFKMAVENGQPDPLVYVGQILRNGYEGSNPNPQQALAYFEEAMKHKIQGAHLNAAELLKESDPQRALDTLKKGFKETKLIPYIGEIINLLVNWPGKQNKEEMKKRKREALEYCHMAMKLSTEPIPDILTAAGHLHLFFNEKAEALKYLKQATVLKKESGEEAQACTCCMVGWLYKYGFSGQPADKQRALEYLRMGADKGCATASFGVYQMLLDEHKQLTREEQPHVTLESLFMKYLLSSADKGYVAAMQDAGKIFNRGEHGIQQDKIRALKYLEQLAEKGNVLALHDTGHLHLIDIEEMPANKSRALMYFERAAHQGNVCSMHFAGMMLLENQDNLKSKQKALSYLTQVAHKGLAGAMVQLCKFYLFEVDDFEQAFHWFEKAKLVDPSLTIDLDDVVSKKLEESQKNNNLEEPEDEITDAESEAFTRITLPVHSHNEEMEKAVTPSQQDKGELTCLHNSAHSAVEEKKTEARVEKESDLIELEDVKFTVEKKEAKGKIREFRKYFRARHIEKNKEDKIKLQLTPNSISILRRLIEKDKHLELKDFYELFLDPFFQKQITVTQTKSGFLISAYSHQTKKWGSCSSHRKYGLSYDGFNPSFLVELWKTLKNVYEL